MHNFPAFLVLIFTSFTCWAQESVVSRPAAHQAGENQPATKPESLLFAPGDASRVTFVWYNEPSEAEYTTEIERDMEKAIGGLRPDQHFNVVCEGRVVGGNFPKDGSFIACSDQAIQDLKALFSKNFDAPDGDLGSVDMAIKNMKETPQAICMVTTLRFPNSGPPERYSALADFAVTARARIFVAALFRFKQTTVTDEFKRLDAITKRTGGTVRGLNYQDLKDAGYHTDADMTPAKGLGLEKPHGIGGEPANPAMSDGPGGIGPKGAVFGNGGNARTIAFVCDASDSMKPNMASVKDQLKRTIVGLRPIQSFDVIFLRERNAPRCPKKS